MWLCIVPGQTVSK